jgi:hypothetical protein
MSLREEQCRKVCRILDDVLANRPTERDSLIAATRRAFDALSESHWIPCSERLPKAKQKVLVQYADGSMATKRCNDAGHLTWFYFNAVAWMPAPEEYRGE